MRTTNRYQAVNMDIDGVTIVDTFDTFTQARSAATRHVREYPNSECVLWRPWIEGAEGREILAKIRA